ncbi:MAG: hypothetical protein BGO49_25915 [Planctomycetales bacterium 71-10]|nr:MAG: hypothetical protein BGO49_25915 [Planctomycetales bacterium 71-10]
MNLDRRRKRPTALRPGGRSFGIAAGCLVSTLFILAVGATRAEEGTTQLDCGANSLFVLLKLEGRDVSVERLDAALPPRRPGGYSMAELSAASSSLGLNLAGERFTGPVVNLDRPAIALFNDKEGGHFLALRPVGVTGTMAQVIDPPHAPSIMDLDQLTSRPGWTGCVLVARPWARVRDAAPWVSGAAACLLLAAGLRRRRR